jgi:hypothetical protein
VSYENATGNLTVNLEPTTGTWRIAGTGTWYTSGQTAKDIVEGTYTIEFGSARGYYDRASEEITIMRNTTLVRSYSYERIVGSLQVHLNPGQARWRLTGQIGWRPSGDVQEGISVGDYDVEFSTVTGFITPGNSRVTVRENQTTYLSITYQENNKEGAVSVTILPAEAAAAGIQWRLSGQTGWLDSGETAKEIVTGTHTVEFSSAANWQSPADREINIKTNQTTSITARAVKSSAPRIHYFTATPENIGGEEESLLEWLVRGADTVSLDHGLGTDLDHESSIKVNPQQSSTYKLTATNAGGTSTAVIDVNVLQKPEIDWFKSSHGPDNPACEGEEISFSWKVVGAEKVSLDTDGDGKGDVSLASEYGEHALTCGGSEQVYTLIAESPVGTSTSKITVPVTQLPSVVSFTAKQDGILYGRSTVLQWETFGGTSVEIHPGLGSFDLTGSTSIRPESDTIYTLIVTNEAGEASASQSITVHDPDKVSDLVIEIEEIDEELLEELNEGDTLPVDVTVTNSGTVDAFDFDVTLRDPRQIADRRFIQVLKAGQSKTITMSYVAVAKGVNRFKAFVDYLDEVVESSEANNVAKAMIKTDRADKVDLLPYDLQVVAYEGTDDVEAVTVSFKIKNIGSKHSDGFQYRVYLNYPKVKGYKNSSVLLDVYNVDELKSGKVYKVSTIGYLKKYQKRAKFKVVVEVDTLLAIAETNEDNNTIEDVITRKYIF